MKEKPILFSGPMVRAILDGRKTQTRRVCKDVPCQYAGYVEHRVGHSFWSNHPDAQGYVEDCPYGAPGTRLWVRETFAHVVDSRGDSVTRYWDGKSFKYIYRADATERPTKWTPPIHMPRVASRITLEITDIRVERLRDISEADAIAEGVEELNERGTYKDYSDHENIWLSARGAYFTLWESINGKGSWNANPWVWVVEFKKL